MKFTLPILLALFLSLSLFGQIPIPSSGRIERHENFQSKFVETRNVDVWLPKNYDPAKKYSVLYMHDGQMLFDSNTTWNHQEWKVDEWLTQLAAKKRIKKCIVVGVWNSGKSRHADYFPQKPFENLAQAQKDAVYAAARTNGVSVFGEYKIQSDNYLKFLVTELKPFIDKTYATLSDAKNTSIAGSSMGGLISMYAICEYPQVFGRAACLSTHWPGIFAMEGNPIPEAFADYMRQHLPDPKTHKIYFDYGDQTLDAMYPPLQKKVDEVMRAKGFSKKNWLTKAFPGDDHSEKAWSRRLGVPLVFLLKK